MSAWDGQPLIEMALEAVSINDNQKFLMIQPKTPNRSPM